MSDHLSIDEKLSLRLMLTGSLMSVKVSPLESASLLYKGLVELSINPYASSSYYQLTRAGTIVATLLEEASQREIRTRR